jgi:hypothetical protein
LAGHDAEGTQAVEAPARSRDGVEGRVSTPISLLVALLEFLAAVQATPPRLRPLPTPACT